MFIPGPNFFHPGYRIRIKKLKYCNPKKFFTELSEIWSGLFIPDPDPDFFPIPDPGSSGQKGTGSLIRIRNADAKWYSFQLFCCFSPYIVTFISTPFLWISYPCSYRLQQLFSSSLSSFSPPCSLYHCPRSSAVYQCLSSPAPFVKTANSILATSYFCPSFLQESLERTSTLRGRSTRSASQPTIQRISPTQKVLKKGNSYLDVNEYSKFGIFFVIGGSSVVDPNPVGSGPFWLCRIRNLTFLTKKSVKFLEIYSRWSSLSLITLIRKSFKS